MHYMTCCVYWLAKTSSTPVHLSPVLLISFIHSCYDISSLIHCSLDMSSRNALLQGGCAQRHACKEERLRSVRSSSSVSSSSSPPFTPFSSNGAVSLMPTSLNSSHTSAGAYLHACAKAHPTVRHMTAISICAEIRDRCCSKKH